MICPHRPKAPNSKITQEHFDYIAEKLNELLAAHPNAIEMYETGQFARAERVNDLQTRFKWDMLNAALPASWICDELYPYMNDSHIDAALNRILPPIERRY